MSPNKTLEGFLGGVICNVFTTWIFSGYFLQTNDRDFWICGTQRYDIGLFENYKCDTVNSIFIEQRVELPFSIFGLTHVNCLPAQFYCVIFGIFASLIGPFAGFLASGIKRAYGIKDFANKFPGHGGFVDRFDCQTLSVIFCALIMSQFIFREDLAMDNIAQAYQT